MPAIFTATAHQKVQECAAGAGAFPAQDAAIVMATADSFVVVSWWQRRSSDPRTGHYEYEPQATLNDAIDMYREYEDGEYDRARAVGIFATRNGLPVGGYLDAHTIIRLMHETRAA